MREGDDEIREELINTVGRITSFWGFGRVMGQIYGLLYLSPSPMTLDDMAGGLSISKGNISINIRALHRWNMVRPVWVKGDRKDYYEAETDFWTMVRGVLREREKKEFDQALGSVSGLHKRARKEKGSDKGDPDAAFVTERLAKLEDFIRTMDRFVSVLLKLEDLKRNLPGLSKG